ncbi:MAG: roadblock/LC7 domain-containing protein [Candidatus Methylomirabilales bacterium]
MFDKGMELDRHLDQLIEKVEGALLALLLDPQGIPVASAPSKPFLDPEALGARYGLLLRELLDVSTRLLGEVRTILFDLEKATLIALPLKDGYTLLLLLQPDGNIGRGIFEAKKAAFALEKKL